MQHFLRVADLDADALRLLLDTAVRFKRDRNDRLAGLGTVVRDDLRGRTVALIFEKPSLRTRVSFQVAVEELGGRALPLFDMEVGLGRRETIADTAKVLSRYVQGIVIRTFGQQRLDELAAHSSVPVVNALSDLEHPCQALADLQTIREAQGGLDGVTLAYVGDGNNVANSLLVAGALSGMHVRVVHPQGYAPDADTFATASRIAGERGGSVATTTDPADGVAGADVVYTDVWASMGQEEEAEQRRAVFAPFRVDARLMAAAADGAVFLHCLPAHRGEEVATEVIDGPRSRVFDQAENRLHAQKALLHRLLGEGRA